MQAVIDDGEWKTYAVTDGRTMDTHRARELMRAIALGTHICGDPGIQFDTTINDWHTCPKTDPINASNPCSEYMFLDDSACNLASLNLMQFVDDDGRGDFNIEKFRLAVQTVITAQEILVGNASYPTAAIERNSHDFRPLGLGYANLGALLMSQGLPYDSDQARAYAAALTALMSGEAYAQSARISRDCGGPFAGYAKNEEPFLRVMRKHAAAVKNIAPADAPANLLEAAEKAWDDAIRLGVEHGYRNAQVTVLAPTGTIGFMMDCDTTGVEPDIALVKYKHLVGGGKMQIVNHTVPAALHRLGYDQDQIGRIVAHIDNEETIEGAHDLDPAHLPLFDCAFKPQKGSRFIHYRGHLKMIGAVQPFISGAISKTINVPPEATVEQIEQAYIEAWKLGAKSVSVYRDGSKRTQPLNTGKAKASAYTDPTEDRPIRRKLPDERKAITHKFDIAGHEGYITVGMYENGEPEEIFLVMAKEGSTISGFGDAFAQAISYSLQYGVPLQVLVDKFSHVRFEPSGLTKNSDIRIAKSVVDYIFRWLASKFMAPEEQFNAGVNIIPGAGEETHQLTLDGELPAAPSNGDGQDAAQPKTGYAIDNDLDAPPCTTCGAIMIRNGRLLQVHELRKHQRLRIAPRRTSDPAGTAADGTVHNAIGRKQDRPPPDGPETQQLEQQGARVQGDRGRQDQPIDKRAETRGVPVSGSLHDDRDDPQVSGEASRSTQSATGSPRTSQSPTSIGTATGRSSTHE